MSTERQTKKQHKQLFFIIGVSMLPIGIATDNPTFIGVGVVFMLLGFSNNKIEKSSKISVEQKDSRKKWIRIIAYSLLILFLTIIVFTFLQHYNLVN